MKEEDKERTKKEKKINAFSLVRGSTAVEILSAS